MQNTQKTSHWQDTNVDISESKLAGGFKIGHYTVNVFFFLALQCHFTETQWNLAKIDESVNKYAKHTKNIV